MPLRIFLVFSFIIGSISTATYADTATCVAYPIAAPSAALGHVEVPASEAALSTHRLCAERNGPRIEVVSTTGASAEFALQNLQAVVSDASHTPVVRTTETPSTIPDEMDPHPPSVDALPRGHRPLLQVHGARHNVVSSLQSRFVAIAIRFVVKSSVATVGIVLSVMKAHHIQPDFTHILSLLPEHYPHGVIAGVMSATLQYHNDSYQRYLTRTKALHEVLMRHYSINLPYFAIVHTSALASGFLHQGFRQAFWAVFSTALMGTLAQAPLNAAIALRASAQAHHFPETAARWQFIKLTSPIAISFLSTMIAVLNMLGVSEAQYILGGMITMGAVNYRATTNLIENWRLGRTECSKVLEPQT